MAEETKPEVTAPAAAMPDSEKVSFTPRRGRGGKVFTNGFKIPGFNAYSDLPGKICVDCGFNALKFSDKCSRCGGELRPE